MSTYGRSKLWITVNRLILIVAGAFIVSLSINGLYLRNELLAGGVSGIAILLNLLVSCNTSLVIILINIPIFIIGYKFINKEFIVYSLVGMLSLSGFLEITKSVDFGAHEMLTTILLGGVINGLGLGLILRANSSTGGNDIISKILNKYFSYSISTLNFAFNLIIIVLSIGFFGLDKAVETLAAMYISAYTVKFILEGVNYKRTVLIITDKAEEVSEVINLCLHRGCTILDGKGAYTGQPRAVLYAIISINQVAKLKMLIRRIDRDAFVNVIETRVVYGQGKGFLDIRE